ncbi:MAG TPA: PilZ domain-containing protein [Thermodesulfobacteriota bacterium]|nr:PilZ domain-containing protein [Thermodesulfobacteriota bacterium]
MKKEEKGTIPRHGTVNFEKRRYPRVNVNLPFEYNRGDSIINHGGAINASEGGLLVYFPEKMEVGQILSLKLFFPSGFEFESIEATVKVVWVDFHLAEDWGDYRAGVMFVNISLGDLEKLIIFLQPSPDA